MTSTRRSRAICADVELTFASAARFIGLLRSREPMSRASRKENWHERQRGNSSQLHPRWHRPGDWIFSAIGNFMPKANESPSKSAECLARNCARQQRHTHAREV